MNFLPSQLRAVDPASLEPNDRIWAQIETALWRRFPSRALRKVLFVAPPHAERECFSVAIAKRGRYQNYPPYGAGLIASHLRRDGVEVQILNLHSAVLKAARACADTDRFDFDAVIEDALRAAIEGFKPDLIGVTCMFAMTQESARRTVEAIHALSPLMPIALGGVHVTNHLAQDSTRLPLLSAFPDVSFFFLYEAEVAFRSFVGVVNGRAAATELSQLVLALPEGWIHLTNRRLPKEGEDLDAIPAHDLMSPREMAENGKMGGFYAFKKPGTLFSTVLSNRGCRAQCTFCSVRSINGIGVRTRSIQSVVDELLMLRHDHGVGHITWLDDDLLYHEHRAIALFNEMVRRNVGLTWDCSNGVIAASCTEELVQAAAAAGCIGMCLGVESGNPARLRKIRKPGKVETFLRAAEVVRRVEQIHARTLLMVGFPGETYRETMDTLSLARDMDLDWNNVNVLQPLPNTPIFDEMMAAGLLGAEAVRDSADPHHRRGGEFTKAKIVDPRSGKAVIDLLALDFKDVFEGVDLASEPPKPAWDDIWAYMNFHLNFNRLKRELRPGKLRQQELYLRNIAEISAPESALAMYFYGYLSKRASGRIDPTVLLRLRARLNASEYWQARFRDFGLAPEDLDGDVAFSPDAERLVGEPEPGWIPTDILFEELASFQVAQQSTR